METSQTIQQFHALIAKKDKNKTLRQSLGLHDGIHLNNIIQTLFGGILEIEAYGKVFLLKIEGVVYEESDEEMRLEFPSPNYRLFIQKGGRVVFYQKGQNCVEPISVRVRSDKY